MKCWKILPLFLFTAMLLTGCAAMVVSDEGSTASQQQEEEEEVTYPGEGFYIGEDYDRENLSYSDDDCITITAEEWEGMILYQIEFGFNTNRYATYIDEIDGSPTEIISFSFDPDSSEGIASVAEATVAVSLNGDVATVVTTSAYGSYTDIYTKPQS